jgi:hypothetical protein
MNTRLLALLFLVPVPGANAQDVETCRLITKADVASAIGRSAPEGEKGAGKLGDQAAFSHCSFMDGNKVLVFATVYAYQISEAEVQKHFEAAKKQAGDGEPVGGLGDDAYWWKSKGSLFVIKDQYMVTVLMGSGVAKLAAAKGLAAKIVQGLPG